MASMVENHQRSSMFLAKTAKGMASISIEQWRDLFLSGSNGKMSRSASKYRNPVTLTAIENHCSTLEFDEPQEALDAIVIGMPRGLLHSILGAESVLHDPARWIAPLNLRELKPLGVRNRKNGSNEPKSHCFRFNPAKLFTNHQDRIYWRRLPSDRVSSGCIWPAF